MYKYINIDEEMYMIEITKAICDTISNYNIKCRDLMFDLSLKTVVEKCNYNANLKRPINNYYGFSVDATKRLIFQFYPEKKYDIKAEKENEEEH